MGGVLLKLVHCSGQGGHDAPVPESLPEQRSGWYCINCKNEQARNRRRAQPFREPRAHDGRASAWNIALNWQPRRFNQRKALSDSAGRAD